MVWTPPKRNFNGIQFEKLRRTVDQEFIDLHDELSNCYYNKVPFRAYGILSKETFDVLHGLVFLKRNVKFHVENLNQKAEDRIPEEEYNDIKGKEEGKKNIEALRKIADLKTRGYDLG